MQKEINQEALRKVVEGSPAERVFLCGEDFSLFFTYYFSSFIKYEYAPFHYDMFDDLKDLVIGVIRELAWIMFRESVKTSMAEAFIVWCIVYKKRKYINVDSLVKTNSERILFTVVNMLQQNQLLIADFGQLYNQKRTQEESTMKRQNDFLTNNGIRVEAHTTGTNVRGRKHIEQRPDLLIMDDFETNDSKDSKAVTLEVIGHMDEFKSGLAPDAWVLYLGNLITEYGSVQTLIERAKADERLRVRQVPVIINGEPSWPSKYALTNEQAKLEGKVSLEDKKKQLGSQVFSAEMMNMPIDETTAEFKKEWVKTIKAEEVSKFVTRNFGTIDPAFSKKDSADDVGICINQVTSENKWYLRAFGKKLNVPELIDTMFILWDRYKLEVWGIEEGSYLLAMKPYLEEEMRKRNKWMTIVTLKHSGQNKETRIRGLLPRYETGSVFHIEGECSKLEDQQRAFPRGLHDDVLDALAYQSQIAKPPYQEEEVVEDEPIYSDIGV